jgi:hypothetical protein
MHQTKPNYPHCLKSYCRQQFHHLLGIGFMETFLNDSNVQKCAPITYNKKLQILFFKT